MFRHFLSLLSFLFYTACFGCQCNKIVNRICCFLSNMLSSLAVSCHFSTKLYIYFSFQRMYKIQTCVQLFIVGQHFLHSILPSAFLSCYFLFFFSFCVKHLHIKQIPSRNFLATFPSNISLAIDIETQNSSPSFSFSCHERFHICFPPPFFLFFSFLSYPQGVGTTEPPRLTEL